MSTGKQNEQGMGFALVNLGNCYYFLGNTEKGIESSLKAISYAEKNNNQSLLGNWLKVFVFKSKKSPDKPGNNHYLN